MPVRFFGILPDDFQRAFDELFDDLLIQRWRLAAEFADAGHPIVRDCGDRYEVRVALGDAAPAAVEVEVSEHSLALRIPSETSGLRESSFSFSHPVERDAVKAKAAGGTLVIVLPKIKRTRRVQVG